MADGADSVPIFGTIANSPRRVGALMLVNGQIYPDKRAGVRFEYRYPWANSEPLGKTHLERRIAKPAPDLQLLKADTYLYDLGLTNLQSGINSEAAGTAFQHALTDISLSAKEGDYRHFEVIMADRLCVPLSAPQPNWLWAVMRYRQEPQAGVAFDGDRISHLAVRSDGGFFNKVRYTYPATYPQQRAYGTFLIFLFEWQRSLVAGLARQPLPESLENFPPEQWPLEASTLLHVPLPHKLGFFDESAVIERQAERNAGHFAAGSNSKSTRQADEILEAMTHELAHAVFAELEKEMAIEVEGIGTFVDARAPGESKED